MLIRLLFSNVESGRNFNYRIKTKADERDAASNEPCRNRNQPFQAVPPTVKYSSRRAPFTAESFDIS
jgi:hypothetical protein